MNKKIFLPPFFLVFLVMLTACGKVADSEIIAYVDLENNMYSDMNIKYKDFITEVNYILIAEGIDEESAKSAENADYVREVKNEVLDYLIYERIHLKEAEMLGIGIKDLTAEEVMEIDRTAKEALDYWTSSFTAEAANELHDVPEDEITKRAEQLRDEYFNEMGLSDELYFMWSRNMYIEQKLYDYYLNEIIITEEEIDEWISKNSSDDRHEAKDAIYNEKELALYERLNDEWGEKYPYTIVYEKIGL